LERVSEESQENVQGIDCKIDEILRLLRLETRPSSRSKKMTGSMAPYTAIRRTDCSPRIETPPLAAKAFLAGSSAVSDSLQYAHEETAEAARNAATLAAQAPPEHANPAASPAPAGRLAGPASTPGNAQHRSRLATSQALSETTPSSVSTTRSSSMHFAHGPPARVAYEPSLEEVPPAFSLQQWKKAGSIKSSSSHQQLKISEESSVWAVRAMSAASAAPSQSPQLVEKAQNATLVPRSLTSTGTNRSRAALPQSLASPGVVVQEALNSATSTLHRELGNSGWQVTSELVLADPEHANLAKSTLPLLQSPRLAARQAYQSTNQLQGGGSSDFERKYGNSDKQNEREIILLGEGPNGVQVEAPPHPTQLTQA
jgi:hypothetical protein